MITINYTYSTHVEVTLYNEDGFPMHYRDNGTLDVIAEQATELLIKQNFVSAEVCDISTGEVLITITRS